MKSLEDSIIREIATHFPYSIEDVKHIYNLYKSFDVVIKTCEASVELGYSRPVSYSPSLSGIEVGRKMNKIMVDILSKDS